MYLNIIIAAQYDDRQCVGGRDYLIRLFTFSLISNVYVFKGLVHILVLIRFVCLGYNHNLDDIVLPGQAPVKVIEENVHK